MNNNSKMRISICSPADRLLVRDEKYARTYKSMGHEIIFIGNKRRQKSVYRNETISSIEYVGIQYPYSSFLIPLGIMSYGIALYKKLKHVSPDCIHARDLEGLFGSHIYKRYHDRSCRLIYDVADTYSARYRFPKSIAEFIQFIDDQMMATADIVLVPQENRVNNFRYRCPKSLHIIPNCPSVEDAPSPVLCLKTGSFRILVSGVISFNRGIREIVRAVEKIGKGVEIIVIAGRADHKAEEFLKRSQSVTLYSGMTQRDVLNMCAEVHLIYAFYEPSRLINRQAAPNKIFDAMASARPVLINSEIETSRQVCEEWGVGYSAPYYETDKLCEIIKRLNENRNECDEKGFLGYKLFKEKYNWEEATRFLPEIMKK